VKLIEAQVSELIAELRIDVTKIEAYIDQASISGDIAAIEQHYLDLQAMARAARDHQPLPFTREEFASAVLGPWDVPAHVYAVLQAMLGNGGLDAGLLNAWTDYLLESTPLPPKQGAFVQAYTLLQGWFQDQIQHVVKGVALATSAQCDAAPADSRCATGSAYLEEIAPHFAAVTERFVSCVERLALRQLDLTAMVKAPATVPPDAVTILERADFLAALLAGQAPGLRGRCLVQPRQADAAKGGPVLQPTAAYPAMTGKLVAIDPAYAASWPRCVQLTSARPHGAQLTPYAGSSVQIVRYAWEWPSPPPPAGQPLAVQSSFRAADYAEQIQVTPRYFDPKTNRPVKAQHRPPAGSVLYGSFLDASALFQDLLSLAEPDEVSPQREGSPLDPLVTLTASYIPQEAQVTVDLRVPLPREGFPEFLDVTYAGRLALPFHYDAGAGGASRLFLYVGYDLATRGQSGRGSDEKVARWVTAQFSIEVDGAKLVQVSNAEGPKSTAGATASGTVKLSRSGTTTVTMSFGIHFVPWDEFNYVRVPDNGFSGSLAARLAFVRLAWQP
jgi:hypothetical protein